MQVRTHEGFNDYLTVGQAAEYLGVSPWTLRNWDKAGKLKPLRHPKNGYRIYRHEDLERLLAPMGFRRADESLAPGAPWHELGENGHFVQFYETDEFLAKSVGGFLAAELAAGGAGVVIATPEHGQAIGQQLAACGIDLSAVRDADRLIFCDAKETLAKFLVDGTPDPGRFAEVVGGVIDRAGERGRRVRAFGEMVALLWAEGNQQAAIRLEEWWNALGESREFSLLCAYPMHAFGGEPHGEPFGEICACHSKVMPAESYARLDGNDDRLREISRLQQKAESLEAEIARRKEVERALAERDRRKDEFLAILAHELRSPLAPISNCLEVMRLHGALNLVAAEGRAIMERQVRQMTRIVDDLLDVSRITQGRLELRKERLELSAVVAEAVETCRPLLEAARHQLSVGLPPQPIYVDGDSTRLGQVFSNLLNNSVKYTDPGGSVGIEAQQENGEAVVSVWDTGVGIAPEALPRIFDMFHQVGDSLDRAAGGLGIGLTLVRSLIEMHGGSVAAFSEGPGTGSRFIVRLPLAAGERQTLEEPNVTFSKTATLRRRILVADDNRDSAATLSMMLQVLGNDVRTAHDGVEAIETAAVFQPEMILMDVGMPRLNGCDATRQIRQTDWGKTMRIIALTGWGQPEDRQRSAEAGFDDHLVKPVDLKLLGELLAGEPQSQSSQSMSLR